MWCRLLSRLRVHSERLKVGKLMVSNPRSTCHIYPDLDATLDNEGFERDPWDFLSVVDFWTLLK